MECRRCFYKMKTKNIAYPMHFYCPKCFCEVSVDSYGKITWFDENGRVFSPKAVMTEGKENL